MIKITDKYYLDTDPYNFIIYERTIGDMPGTKRYGKEIFTSIAYLGNLAQLKQYLFEKQLFDNVELLLGIDTCLNIKEELGEIGNDFIRKANDDTEQDRQFEETD